MSAMQAREDPKAILAAIDVLSSKVDGLLTDSRHDNTSNKATFDGIRRELRALRHRVETSSSEELKKQLDELQGQLLTVAGVLGRAPAKLDSRVSQTGQLTAEEIAELERGTGVAGVVGRLVVGQDKLVRRTGAVAGGVATAGASPAWLPDVVEFLTRLGLVRTLMLVGVLVVVAVLALAVRAVRKRQRRL